MSKITYEDWSPRADALALVECSNQIIDWDAIVDRTRMDLGEELGTRGDREE